MLLPTAELKSRLQQQFSDSRRCWIYSAFISQPGIDFVLGHRHEFSSDRLLVRCDLRDVMTGACSLAALKSALDAGFEVRLSSALHVKLYFFDEKLFVGSANLTGKGLALIGYCNDELSTEGEPTARDAEIAENLWSQGTEINHARLVAMQKFIEQLDTVSNNTPASWPDAIFVEERDLYCSDFPQNTTADSFRWNDIEKFKVSPAYLWLISSVEENGGSASFGWLSKKLHTDVYDDPAPYRRNIKELLENLLDLVVVFQPDGMCVERPNVSSVVFLRD